MITSIFYSIFYSTPYSVWIVFCVSFSLFSVPFLIYRWKRLPLEIIFDPRNPANRFWSMESQIYENGNKKPIVFWEYRVEIKNRSFKTIRNVSLTKEHVGQMGKRPVDQIFDKIKQTSCDLKPGCRELVPVIRWPIQRLPGMLANSTALEYGPIVVTVSGDDVLPTTRIFQFDWQQTPMIFD